MRTGNRRPARSRKTSGTPPDSENPSQKREGQRSGGNFRRKSEGGSPSGYRKSDGTGRKPYGDKPYSRNTGRSFPDRKKSFDKTDGGFQKDKPAFNKEGKSERPPFRRENTGRPPFRKEGDADRPRFRKSDSDKPRFQKEGGRSYGERSGGYKKPYSPARRSEDSDRFRKSDNDKPRYPKPGGKPYGERTGGYKKPYGTPRPDDKRESQLGDAPKWNRKEKHEFYGDRKRKFSKKPFRKNESSLPIGGRDGAEAVPSDGSIRLNKYISNAGICSRREADELIAAGVISVNGNVVTTLGYKVQPNDIVKYNDAKLKSEKPVYLLLNKPKDFITTVDDPQNRNTVMSLIRNACKERVYPVGRLDRNTTGLLLFTNDGDLADKLTHPSFEIQKVYEVHLDKNLKREDFEAISEGVQLEDGLIRPDEISYSSDSKSVIGIELHSGRNRIVRRIFEHFGYRVVKLDRVLYAGLTKKDLPRSKWRFLTDMELANLKMMTGNKKFKAAPKRISLAEE